MSFTGLWNNTEHLSAFPKADPQISVDVKPSMTMVFSIYPAWASVSIATFNPTCANGQQTKTFHNLPCAPVRITGNQKTNISKTFFRAGFGQVWRLG